MQSAQQGFENLSLYPRTIENPVQKHNNSSSMSRNEEILQVLYLQQRKLEEELAIGFEKKFFQDPQLLAHMVSIQNSIDRLLSKMDKAEHVSTQTAMARPPSQSAPAGCEGAQPKTHTGIFLPAKDVCLHQAFEPDEDYEEFHGDWNAESNPDFRSDFVDVTSRPRSVPDSPAISEPEERGDLGFFDMQEFRDEIIAAELDHKFYDELEKSFMEANTKQSAGARIKQNGDKGEDPQQVEPDEEFADESRAFKKKFVRRHFLHG